MRFTEFFDIVLSVLILYNFSLFDTEFKPLLCLFTNLSIATLSGIRDENNPENKAALDYGAKRLDFQGPDNQLCECAEEEFSIWISLFFLSSKRNNSYNTASELLTISTGPAK